MKDIAKIAGVLLLVAVLFWWTVANFVFAVRHPWATSTERLIYLPTVMTFGSLDYDEARPRGKE